nr:MAG TPA: hypothetical protein [Bacteriophage sp.]
MFWLSQAWTNKMQQPKSGTTKAVNFCRSKWMQHE